MSLCMERQVRLIKVATMAGRARIGKGVRFQPGLSQRGGRGPWFKYKAAVVCQGVVRSVWSISLHFNLLRPGRIVYFSKHLIITNTSFTKWNNK